MERWETGEGRLICNGRRVLGSDQIVLLRQGGRGCAAYVHAHPGLQLPSEPARLLLDDGRSGLFRLVRRRGTLLCLHSENGLR